MSKEGEELLISLKEYYHSSDCTGQQAVSMPPNEPWAGFHVIALTDENGNGVQPVIVPTDKKSSSWIGIANSLTEQTKAGVIVLDSEYPGIEY